MAKQKSNSTKSRAWSKGNLIATNSDFKPSEFLLLKYKIEYSRKRLAWQIVGVTGKSPHSAKSIKQRAEEAGAYLTNGNVLQDDAIIVIGRKDFNMDFLRMTVQRGIENKFRCSYISQEAFIDKLERDIPPMYFSGDIRIKEHPGLSFLASIGFKWPSTKVKLSRNSSDARFARDWNDYAYGKKEFSPLRDIYGYSVQKGISEAQRHNALQRAIRNDALGLRIVAEHIAWLVRERKLQRGERMLDAIENWESDLEWLEENYYKTSYHSFVWPQ